jgi:hypothetical protein
LRPLEKKFPLEFREWLANLQRLYLWSKAGYTIPNEMLDFEQWQALAVLTRYYEVKDIEAQIPRVVE